MLTTLSSAANYMDGNAALTHVQQSVTVAAALTPIPAEATSALVQFEGAGRYTIAATAVTPTTSLGVKAADGESIVVEGVDNLANFRAIGAAGTIKLNVIYFRKRGI